MKSNYAWMIPIGFSVLVCILLTINAICYKPQNKTMNIEDKVNMLMKENNEAIIRIYKLENKISSIEEKINILENKNG